MSTWFPTTLLTSDKSQASYQKASIPVCTKLTLIKVTKAKPSCE
jgi:hypothetical protein